MKMDSVFKSEIVRGRGRRSRPLSPGHVAMKVSPTMWLGIDCAYIGIYKRIRQMERKLRPKA